MATKKTVPFTAPEQEHNDVVMIELDRPRELHFGHKAMQRFSALRHCSILNILAELEQYDAVSCAAYCMLATDDENLTVAQVDDLLEKYTDPVSLYIKVTEAVTLAFPRDDVADDVPDDETPQTAAGTGEKA